LSIALYGAETWTLREVYQKNREILKCGTVHGWRKSARRIVWEMKHCMDSRTKEMSYA